MERIQPDRAQLQAEAVPQLTQEVNRVATTTQFNGQNVIDGTLTGAQFQVGANANRPSPSASAAPKQPTSATPLLLRNLVQVSLPPSQQLQTLDQPGHFSERLCRVNANHLR